MANGRAGGDAIHCEVDSEIARHFLEEFDALAPGHTESDQAIQAVLQEIGEEPLTNEWLADIAGRHSVDFSALVFSHVMTNRHQTVKSSFLKNYHDLKNGKAGPGSGHSHFKFILVPGLFYRSKPETKGDLREVKAALESAGFETVSVPILEAGTVEENAGIIADFVEAEPSGGKRFVIVSTSKGGPDTHFALGHRMSPEALGKVALWFSVGGALRGSPLADAWMSWPKRWLAAGIGLFAGFGVPMVESLSRNASLRRLQAIRLPESLRVVHFVGVPLSGSVIDEVREPYQHLRKLGPNDGITLLADEILEGSTVITALGLDHWFRDPDLQRKILALAWTVLASETDNFHQTQLISGTRPRLRDQR